MKFWIRPSNFQKKVRIISKFSTDHQKTFFIHTVFLQHSRQNHRRMERAYAAYRPLSHCSFARLQKSGPAPQNVCRAGFSDAANLPLEFFRQLLENKLIGPGAEVPHHVLWDVSVEEDGNPVSLVQIKTG